MANWDNRIVGHGVENPDQLLANPGNWRVHPKYQQDALKGVLDSVGWVQNVMVNKITGHVVDGHLRVALALRHDVTEVPVVYVELSEAEENLVLATLDPITGLAVADSQKLDDLLRDVQSDDAAIQQMLSDLAMKPYVPDDKMQLEPFLDGAHTVTIHCSFEALSDIKPILETWIIRDDITVNIS